MQKSFKTLTRKHQIVSKVIIKSFFINFSLPMMGCLISTNIGCCRTGSISGGVAPGDLIEISIPNRKPCSPNGSHWALVESIGTGGHIRCYHVARDALAGEGRGVVRYERLDSILDTCADESADGFVYWRVNNQQKLGNHLLAITGREAPPLETVILVLNHFRDREVVYNPMIQNSEHYVTYWRYGIGWSSGLHSKRWIADKAIKVVKALKYMKPEVIDIQVTTTTGREVSPVMPKPVTTNVCPKCCVKSTDFLL